MVRLILPHSGLYSTVLLEQWIVRQLRDFFPFWGPIDERCPMAALTFAKFILQWRKVVAKICTHNIFVLIFKIYRANFLRNRGHIKIAVVKNHQTFLQTKIIQDGD